jgi:5-methylcytosine-specific restriction endonuclease McrA
MSDFRKPCLECGLPGMPGAARCPSHTRLRDSARNEVKRKRRGSTPVAQAMRRALVKENYATCTQCRVAYPVWDIAVDHIKPLADGGLDREYNIQVLCRPCHNDKTREENRLRRKR